jgi:hypothetical protein
MPSSEPEEVQEPVRPRRRGIYVLPNAVTLAALFAGFYGIVMAMSGRFEAAAIGIFCAAILDRSVWSTIAPCKTSIWSVAWKKPMRKSKTAKAL